MTLIKPPLQIVVSRPTKDLNLISIDEPTFVDVTLSEYADLIPLADIIAAPEVAPNVDLLYSSAILDRVRLETNDESVGVLRLQLFDTTILLVVDDEREVHVEEVVVNLRSR